MKCAVYLISAVWRVEYSLFDDRLRQQALHKPDNQSKPRIVLPLRGKGRGGIVFNFKLASFINIVFGLLRLYSTPSMGGVTTLSHSSPLCLQMDNCLCNPGRCIEKIAMRDRWLLWRNIEYWHSPLSTLLYPICATSLSFILFLNITMNMWVHGNLQKC